MLIPAWVVLLGYTLLVVGEHGFSVYGDGAAVLGAMAWPGQFTVDLSCFILVAAAWAGWRHRFSAAGWVAMVGMGLGGFLFFAPYVLVVGARAGTMRGLLLGRNRT